MRHDETDSNEGFSSEESQKALHSLRSLSQDPSPFLKTRVLARAREKQNNKKSLFLKYFFQSSLVTAILVVVAVSLFSKTQKSDLQQIASYVTGQAYVIRMDIRPYKESAIAYAEIVLDDDNIEFSSKQHIEISQQKKLVVSWENVVQKQFLPIVIKGTKPGSSKVIVNFYDSENKLVNSQNVNLNFKGG